MSGVSQSRVDGGTFAFGSLVNCLVQLPNKRTHTEKSKRLKKYCFIKNNDCRFATPPFPSPFKSSNYFGLQTGLSIGFLGPVKISAVLSHKKACACWVFQKADKSLGLA